MIKTRQPASIPPQARQNEVHGALEQVFSRMDGFAFVVVLLALALRLFRLDYQSFWADEGDALHIARLPYSALLSALASREPHPPLYYGLLHLWRVLAGESDFALRLPSVLFSVLAVVAIYGLGRQLGGRRVAFSAALLATVNPFQIWYAQETRMYGMLVGLTAWSVLLFLNAIKRGGAWRWALYSAVTALAIYSHYHALFIVIFENLIGALWWLRTRRRPLGWFVTQGVLLVLFLPWVYFAQRVFRSYPGWMARVDLATMLTSTFTALTLGTTFPPPWTNMASIALAVWAGLALVLLLVHRSKVAVLLAAYALVPLVGTYLVGELLNRPMFNVRYLIVASPALYLLLGFGLSNGNRFLRRIRLSSSLLGVLVAGGLGLIALNNYYFDPQYQKDDLRGMAHYVDANARQGDFVVVSIAREWAYQRYSQHPLPSYVIQQATTPSELGSLLGKVVPGHRRVWYIPYARSDVDLAGDRWLAENAYPATERWFNTARIDLIGVSPPATPQSIAAAFGDRLQLVGYSLPSTAFVPGDVIDLSAFWQAQHPGGGELKASLRLLDAHDHIITQLDRPLGQGFQPVAEWQSGQTVRDNYGLFVPVDTPPGAYRLELRVYDPVASHELAVSEEHGVREGEGLTLGKVDIRLPAVPANALAQDVAHPVDATFGDVARLAGFDLPAPQWQAGNQVTLTLSWQGLRPGGRDYRPVLRLLDASGAEAARHDAPVTALPIASWRPGELVRQIEDWRLPPGLAAGTYQVALSVESPDGAPVPLASGDRRLILGRVALSARPNYTPPAPPKHATDYTFGGLAQLTGYDLSATTLRPAGVLHLTLHWHAAAETEQSYKVFTHLLSPDDHVRGQEDSIPCAGNCPTSSWAAGESLSDQYTLTLQPGAPSGVYRLEVGMYRPSDGQRLPAVDAAGRPMGDRIILGEVTVP